MKGKIDPVSLALGLGVGVGVAVVANTLLSARVKPAKRITNATPSTVPNTKEWGPEDEEILQEQMARMSVFVGEDGFKNIRKAFVIVVGLGGVGSNAAHMLVRSGIEHIRLIDFDQVTLSSLNRHAVATRADVGIPKVECMKQHLLEINPHCRIEAINSLFCQQNAHTLLSQEASFVVDCIDNIETKVSLCATCHGMGIPLIVSMGAGARADPTRIRIADITNTLEDPLSRSVRQRLRRLGVTGGIPCVFSTERTEVDLLPRGDHVTDASEFQVLPGFRVRILPVMGPTPAIFGCAMASYVLCNLAGKPFEPYAVISTGNKQYAKMCDKLRRRETQIFGAAPENFLLTEADIRFVVEDLWRLKSPISGTVHKLDLTRWDVSQPASHFNLVLLNEKEMALHGTSKGPVMSQIPPDVVESIQNRLKSVKDVDM